MNELTFEEANELIVKNKDSVFILCGGGNILISQNTALYIAFSEESAKKYFDSWVDNLPDNCKEFSAYKIEKITGLRDLAGYFSKPSYRYIVIIDYGYVSKEGFILKNEQNIEHIYNRMKGSRDNSLIGTILTKDFKLFSLTTPFKQIFLTRNQDVTEFIDKYNTEELGLNCKCLTVSDIVLGGRIDDLLNCSFDGVDCSGWDVIEGIIKVFNDNFVGSAYIKDIFENKNNGVIISKETGKDPVKLYGNLIVFTSKEIADIYMKKYIKDGETKYEYKEITDKTEYMKLANNSKFIFVNEQVHCRLRDFFMGLGLVKEQREWKTIEEVKEKVNEVWGRDKLYIILSLMPQNIKGNTSVPYIVDMNRKCLWIFEKLEEAKSFIDMADKGKINGKYPIGIIDSSKIPFNLNTTLSIAAALGIPDIEINPEQFDCLHISIQEFFEFGNKVLDTNFSVLQTDEEYKNNPATGVFFNPFNLEIE